jgi:Sulfatase
VLKQPPKNDQSPERTPADPTGIPRPGLPRRTAATARQLVDFCASHPMWLASMAIFALAWTIELYAVQAVTLVYPNETTARFAFWAPKIRLMLDLLFVLGLTFWLRRRWLCGVIVAAFFVYLGLLTYFHYFQKPLSLLTIFGNWREGVHMGEFALNLIPLRAALALATALAIELAALYVSRKASLPRNCAWLAGGVMWLAYAGLYLVALRLDPLDAIQTTRGIGRLGEIRGFLGPWFAEWYYLSDNKVLERALVLRNVTYDRLTPIEGDIPIHKHLVILQAESLDYNVLGYRVDDVEVTPFLNALRGQSMFYRVTAMHFNGSSDADFAALNAVSGSRHENTYIIPGYPYQNTTPQFLARCGFATYSFHGKSGEFYNRRAAFDQMGFAGILFREELEKNYDAKSDRWGVADADLLAVSAQEMRTATSPTCHFVITLTTHVPYIYLKSNEQEIYPRPRTIVQNYMNNMRYLDNCLRQYVMALGSGTTVMIYADHPTEEGAGDFTPDRAGGREFIPCFIYDSDQELSKLQKTRGQPIVEDGTLNLVDVINYLRAQVKRVYGHPAPAPPEPAPAAKQLEHAEQAP